ncbi:hypothetical protein BH23BAC1_BH23BAC1_17410 [soil metagenome]
MSIPYSLRKRLKLSFFFLIFSKCFLIIKVFAVTEVSPATGGTNLCIGGGYVTLGDIKVQEGTFSDFSSSGSLITYIISVPANFEFEPGKGTVTVIGNKISGISMVVTTTTITINYSQTSTNGNPQDGFNISGIRVRAINTPSSGQILRTGGTAVHAGNPAMAHNQLNHGTLISYNFPLPEAQAGADRTVFLGNSTVLGGSPTASGSFGPYSYIWHPATGLNDVSLANPTANPQVTTTYIVTIIDGNGCTDTDDVTVTVDPALPPGPSISAGGATEFCLGESVILSSSENSGNQWFKNGELLSGETNKDLLVNSSGFYQVSFFNGSVNSALSSSVEIEVYDLPLIKNIAAQQLNLCNGGSTLIEVQASQSGITYQLRKGIESIGGAVVGNGNSIFLPTGSLPTGIHSLNVIATHPVFLCANEMGNTVEINVEPEVPTPSIISSPATSLCEGEGNITLTATTGFDSYQWYRNNVFVTSTLVNTLTLSLLNESGNYQVKGIINTTIICESSLSGTIEITINPLPLQKTLTAASPNLCEGNTTNIRVQNSQVGILYQLRNDADDSLIGEPVGGTGGTINLPTGTINTSTTYNVLATNAVFFCATEINNSVSINVEPSLTVPSLDISPSSNLCEGEGSITLTATAGFDSYQWFKNNTLISSSVANTLSITQISESGNYQVKGIKNSPVQCESALSESVQVNLNPLPQQITITASSVNVCGGNSAFIIVPNSNVGVLYQLRNNADNSLIGENVAGTGANLNIPTGIINSNTTFNVVAKNALSNCIAEMSDLVTISTNPAILVTASTETDQVCLDGTDHIVLKSTASGGQGSLSYHWSGPDGFSSNLQDPLPFIPTSFGNLEYQVEVQDEFGCSSSASILVKVHSIPTVYLSNNADNNTICEGKNVRFNAFGAQNYEFLINGAVVQSYGPSSVFNTSTLEDSHIVTVRGYNSNGCLSESTEAIFEVNPNPSVSFSGLNAEYCLNNGPVNLTGFPTGGIFTGNGIKNAQFIPDLAGIGNHIINYTYTNSNTGCISTFSQLVEVKSAPLANFTAPNVCIGTSLGFQDLSTPGGIITAWEWNFGDNSPLKNIQNPFHIFTNAGVYSVTLKVTSNTGCEHTIIKEINVEEPINPDYNFHQLCEGASTKFTDNSGSGIISYLWNFDDPSSGAANISELKNPEHVFSKSGSYEVRLTITTILCTSSVTKIVNILPSIGAGNFPYYEGFESNTGGWVAGGSNSSWRHGIPSGTFINNAGGGLKAWSTQANNNSYNNNEQSYVYSPCFDFSGLQRPMISLKYWSYTDKAKDGAVIQYSLDNGGTWERLGNIGEGIDWYNQGSIISQPGGFSIGQEGWSGKENGWKTASFNLDLLLNQPLVRFRIAFSSVPGNVNKNQYNGFAFDDVWIGERSRMVILEHFTNASKAENEDADLYVNNISETNSKDIISIHYHTDRPVTSILNQDNTADPSARSQYYGISQSPRVVLDGNFFNGKSTDWNQNNLKHRSLVNPAFDIDITLPAVSQDELEVQVTVKSRYFYNEAVVVQIAVVEEVLVLNGKQYKNVLKKLLPDGAGTSFMEQWQPGTQKFVNGYWNVNRLYGEQKELKVIVYVQNVNTKEILQASFKSTSPKKNLITTGIEPVISEELKTSESLVIYPIPGSQNIFCQFSEPITRQNKYYLTDQRGVIVSQGFINKGESELVIDVRELADGMYFLKIISTDNESIYRKILIRH